MRLIYILIAYLVAPIFSGVMLWRGFRDRSYWHNFGERFGFGPYLQTDSIWVHAVSVGEVQAAAAFVKSLRQRYPAIPLVLSTVTPTGAERARAILGSDVLVRFVPYDLPGAVHRFFDRIRPRLAVIFETELWPNLFHECGRRHVPLLIASARISPRSVGRYRRLAGLFKEALANGIVIAAQSAGDAERFRSIGASARRTYVMGNIKFDFEVPADTHAKGRALRMHYAPNRPVWIAGSTHEGEEDILLSAHRKLREMHPDALLILVPRHRNRFTQVAGWLEKSGVQFVTRSSRAVCRPDTAVLLVDTLGELLDFYAAADVAFVAGSLVPIGGHNLLEPAALGLPILTGPYYFNGEDIARLLIARGAGQIVHNDEQLARAIAQLLENPAERERIGALGCSAVEENRGALAKLLSVVEPLLTAAAAAE